MFLIDSLKKNNRNKRLNNKITINSPLKSKSKPPMKDKEIMDNKFFFSVSWKKKYKNNIVKKICKDIEDIWPHAYKCKGIRENKMEL